MHTVCSHNGPRYLVTSSMLYVTWEYFEFLGLLSRVKSSVGSQSGSGRGLLGTSMPYTPRLLLFLVYGGTWYRSVSRNLPKSSEEQLNEKLPSATCSEVGGTQRSLTTLAIGVSKTRYCLQVRCLGCPWMQMCH